MTLASELHANCRRLAASLLASETKLVLAESCTAGLIAASFGRIPGVSAVFCGSAVTYRNDTKACWLDVSRQVLQSPGPVSQPAAEQMARGTLARTPEADIVAAVTGHLGPAAPLEEDGVIFVAIGRRGTPSPETPSFPVQRFQLASRTRLSRQQEASLCVVQQVMNIV